MDSTILHRRRVAVAAECKINLLIEHWKGYLVVEEVVGGAEAEAGAGVEEEEEEEEDICSFVANASTVENINLHETLSKYG